MSKQAVDPEDVKLIEPGDFVRLKTPYKPALLKGADSPDEFTHAVVAEVVSELGPAHFNALGREVIAERDFFPRNVAVHPFNPETMKMHVGDHPTEPGKPEYVDMHVAGLVLIHKRDETWGNEYEIDPVEQYDKYGHDMSGWVAEDE